MKKRIRFKSLLADFFVLVICSSGIYWFGRLFWQDLNSASKRYDKTEIGVITFKRNVAQRRFGDRAVWERLSQSAPVYDTDILRTTDDASATITFKDGTTLDLNESSMLQLSYSEDGGLKIDMTGGVAQVQAGSGNVQLALADGSSVGISAGSSVSAGGVGGKQSLEVLEGSASVSNADGGVTSLSSGESAVIGADGVSKKALTVVAPKKESLILNPKNGSPIVKFSWTLADGAEGTVTVQISGDKNFSSILSNSVAQKEKTMVLDALDGIPESGTVYWRAFFEKDMDSSSTGKITVEKIPPVTAVSPAEDSVFKYLGENPRIHFSWNGNDFATKYRVRVSRRADMKNEVLQTETEETFLDLQTLSAGSYYWTVEPFYATGGIGYSGQTGSSPFTVLHEEKIPAPELTVPAVGAELTYRDEPRVSFAWNSDVRDCQYDFSIARDKDFKIPVYSSTEVKTRAVFEFENVNPVDGEYWWRVVRRSSDPSDTDIFSEPRNFVLRRYVPKRTELLFPPEGFSAEAAQFERTQFVWQLDDKFIEKNPVSVIQVSASEDFSSATEYKTQGLSYTGISLDEGHYYWRVGVEGDDSWTRPKSFYVAGALVAPRITSPVQAQEFLSSGRADVRFAWARVNGADYYEVGLYDAKGNSIKESPRETGLSQEFSLTSGKYRASVQAFAENGMGQIRKGPVSDVDFFVRVPKSLSTLLPTNGSRILGLDALSSPTVFSWEKSADSSGTDTIILRRQGPDGTYSEIRRESTSGSSISFGSLSAGGYEWLVRTISKSGEVLSSPASYFTVVAIPRLSRPAAITPGDKSVLDGSYFKTRRTVLFSWRQSPDATSYVFELYRRGSSRPIFERRIYGQTQVEVSDLSLFDVGTFEWRVTAFRNNASGIELQRSQTESATFEIKFSRPDEVWSKKPGAMYAE